MLKESTVLEWGASLHPYPHTHWPFSFIVVGQEVKKKSTGLEWEGGVGQMFAPPYPCLGPATAVS